MTLRFQKMLLAAFLVALLNACGTTGPVPVEKTTPVFVPPPETEPVENRDVDFQYRDPSDRSLEEVMQLTRQMSGYEPDTALEIIRSLESLPSGQLITMIDSQIYDPEFTEWLELALQTRNALLNQAALNTAAQKWANYHYGHVITKNNFIELVKNYGRWYPAPAQVAVLVPTEGGLSMAAKAIRDGILSAYLEDPGQSVLRFYSSGNSNETALAAYMQALDDGATQIVGPLRSDSAGALASLENTSVPILLLNEPNEEQAADPMRKILVNSISLSQAEEAKAIAKIALSQDQQNALVIVPDSGWGKRIESAFISSYEEGEGRIAASTRFNTANEDYSDMLTRLLKIDESEQRKADLQSRLGVSLTFEPNRRDDFDFIFMAANPKEARELKPLLRFHDAGDIPVYGMGRIYSGQKEVARDQDLNGIIFPISNWDLQAGKADTQALESLRDGAYGNLYALGQDAWHVLPLLPLLQKDEDLWYPGDIGLLKVQSNGHLERQPNWAQFSAGQPVPYTWPVIR